MAPAVSFRPIADEDEDFLRRLYATTRADEMAVVPWPEGQKAEFLAQQFEAQHGFYTEQFRGAAFDLVLLDGEPAGRLYVDRREAEIRLIDIALLPEHRGRGIGGKLLEDLIEEARGRDLPLRIHVEQFNPAMSLYLRLGFEPIEEQGPYHLMEWAPRRG